MLLNSKNSMVIKNSHTWRLRFINYILNSLRLLIQQISTIILSFFDRIEKGAKTQQERILFTTLN